MDSSSTVRECSSHNGFFWLGADAYLFDIDGTLLNTRDAVHYNAFHNAMRRFFAVSSRIDTVPVHGNTDPAIIRAVLEREGVPECDIRANLPLLIDHMCAEVERGRAGIKAELCPSVVEMLETLSRAGKLLGVASGNLERIAWTKLEASGLRHYFRFGSFSDRYECRADILRNGITEARRLLAREEAKVYVVGDTPADISAAHAAGAPVIAVATGIFSSAELLAHAPDTCVGCLSDLLASI